MAPWMLLTVLVAAINLSALLAVRGRWGRVVWLLIPAALAGTAAGNALGAATDVELLRVGDFHVVAASAVAQLAMLAALLLRHLGPTAAAEK